MNTALATYPGDAVGAIKGRTAARLHRLSQRVRLNGLGHRRLSGGDTRALTTAILRDIDETILPRHVRVTTNAGQTFTLDVAGRRLLRMVISGSGGSVSAPDDPFEAARVLAGELKRALIRATEVTLQTYRMDSAQDREDVGSSASTLADALGLDLEALDGESTTKKAMRALGRQAQGLVVVDGHGHITQTLGNDVVAGWLQDLAEAHLHDITLSMAQTLGRNQKNGCMSLGTDTATGAHLVCAMCDKVRILALVDARHINALMPVLQDIFTQ
ncbi:MAG: hypothetical protein WAO69_11810 [Aestuariivita sp.]|uniref:hypothetical protein n=1 Tax=Aestuariivita sp. TaxID=1872407 RepID=UPI003BB19434